MIKFYRLVETKKRALDFEVLVNRDMMSLGFFIDRMSIDKGAYSLSVQLYLFVLHLELHYVRGAK